MSLMSQRFLYSWRLVNEAVQEAEGHVKKLQQALGHWVVCLRRFQPWTSKQFPKIRKQLVHFASRLLVVLFFDFFVATEKRLKLRIIVNICQYSTCGSHPAPHCSELYQAQV